MAPHATKAQQQPDIIEQYPLSISFIGEKAYDAGGVCRDMLTGFWEEAYRRPFDG